MSVRGTNGASVVRASPRNRGYWRREMRELRELVGKDIDGMTDDERADHFDRVRRFNQRQSVSPFNEDLRSKARALDRGAAEH